MIIKTPKLRPHHILCMHAFSGMGYSDSFVDNMTDVIEEIKEFDLLEIIFTVDDICKECPHLVEGSLCDSNNRVNALDERVIKAYNLEQRVYRYSEIISKLQGLSHDQHRAICKECSWYNSGSCRDKIIRRIDDYIEE